MGDVRRHAAHAREEHAVAGLLRAVDRSVVRPPGTPVTLDRLQRLAHRRRLRALALVLLGLLLPGTVAGTLAVARSTPAPATDPGVARWLQRLRARDAESGLRQISSLQRAALARERAALAVTLYAERVAVPERDRSVAMLEHVVAALPGTRGANDAARLLAAMAAEPPLEEQRR